MYPKIMLILLAVAAGGCSPLRNINAERHATLDIADSTLTALVRQELERQVTSLTQTVIEFYPPAIPVQAGSPDSARTVVVPLADTSISVPQQSVRRIIRTEVVAANDRTTVTDSVSYSRINAAARNDEQSVLDETPNTAGASWLKWTAACLLLVLIIALLFKLR